MNDDYSDLPPVEGFIRTHYSPELAEDLLNALDLFEQYQTPEAISELEDTLFGYAQSEESDPNVVELKFTAIINQHLDRIFQAHSVTLFPEATIGQKNQILGAFSRLTTFEDPVVLLRILEGTRGDEEKLAKILEILTSEDEVTFLPLIESMDSRFLETIKKALQEREAAMEQPATIAPEHHQAILDFITVVGQDNIIYEAVTSGLLLGCPIETYLPFFTPMRTDIDDLHLAINTYGLLLLGSDTYLNPNQHFDTFLDSLDEVGRSHRVRQHLSNIITSINNYQRARDEQTRLSPVQHS